MKKYVIIFFSFLFFQTLQAQNEFITVWKPGNSQLIHFPGRGTNFNVTWEETGYPQHNGNLTGVNSTLEFLINFGNPQNPIPANATYKIKVSNGSGNFYQVKFFDSMANPAYTNSDHEKIIDITQWGNIQWQTFDNAFVWCSNMNVTASDAPNLTNITQMNEMFYLCFSLVGSPSFDTWNTSTVNNMFYMFGENPLFNAPINNWNVSNVTNMSYMFDAASSFNQTLSKWNTSNVTTMQHMFHEASSFNQDLRGWNTLNVTNMNEMFHDATSFNQNLGSWNLLSLNNAVDLFLNSGLNCQNYDSTLHGWSLKNETPGNIVLSSVSPLVYSHPAAVSARNYLINTKGWTISGDTHNPNCSSILSTSENISKTEISIYPNPVNDFINIKNLKNISSYKIIDFSGRVIQSKNNFIENRIDVTSLSKGNYILEITSKHSVENFKFIKK
jgi:surface protein